MYIYISIFLLLFHVAHIDTRNYDCRRRIEYNLLWMYNDESKSFYSVVLHFTSSLLSSSANSLTGFSVTRLQGDYI